MMPAFSAISAEERQALVGFLFGDEKEEAGVGQVAAIKRFTKKPLSPYRISGYTKFLDADGLPAISPPWGTLNAINLNTGEYVWKTVFGEHPGLAARGIPPTGAESYGGPVVTASGLLFIAVLKTVSSGCMIKKRQTALADAASGGSLCHASDIPGKWETVCSLGLWWHQTQCAQRRKLRCICPALK
jgi:hypothetical protein